MKNKMIIKLITAAVMLAAVVALTASCGTDRYEQLDKDGYTVSVTFDPNGGAVKGTQSVIQDVYCLDNYTPDASGKIKIPLVEPTDSVRDPSNPLTITKNDHFLAGWYRERTPIDENDLSKGYTYSGKWDFSKDTLTLDPDGNYSSAESVVTLYAAWIPFYNFEIYALNENGRFETLTTHKGLSLTVPTWKDGKATIDMGNFPKRSGYTLEAVYLDKDCTKLASESVTGSFNEATGTVSNGTVKLYTTWIKGDYYKIYSADDLRKNAKSDATYEIMSDIDFSSVKWPAAFQRFSGTIIGNGHVISGVKISSESRNKNNGLFGQIDSGAVIRDITFENITHTINTGLVTTDATFGLLAGTVSTSATFENVVVSGKILIGDKCENLKGQSYTIGLVAGSGTPVGAVAGDITCQKENPSNSKLTFSIEIGKDSFVNLVFK